MNIFYFRKFHFSMSRLIFIYIFFNIIPISFGQNRRRQNYQIEWNSSNPFFQSKPPVLNVRLGDIIDFLCPHNQSSSIEYNTLYLVSEIDYNLCFTKNYQPLFRCDQSNTSKRSIYTLSISKYLPYPNMPEFLDGRSYYFISTSNGQLTGIDQTFDGLCRTKNFRLIVDVQKYYRKYGKSDNSQYRMRIQKQLTNQTIEHSIFSSSKRLSSSIVVLFITRFLYLCSLM